jgi:hypothetical protein
MGRSSPAMAAEGQRLGVHAGDPALVRELHLGNAGLGQLTGERAELFRERDEGPQLRRLLRCDRGKLTALEMAPAQEVVRHLLSDLQRDVLLRLGGGGPEVRGAHHVRVTEQWIRGRRLLGEHVEGGTSHVTGIEGGAQRAFLDQPAARAIDDAHALLHGRERLASMMFLVLSVSGVCRVRNRRV